MTRTPSKSTLAIRAFAKVRRLRDEFGRRAAAETEHQKKHGARMKELRVQITDAEATYRELTGESLPAAASSDDAE